MAQETARRDGSAPSRDDVARVLVAAGADVEAYGVLHLDAIETRDLRILWAIDHGYERSWVARHAGISPARVTQVVARRAAAS